MGYPAGSADDFGCNTEPGAGLSFGELGGVGCLGLCGGGDLFWKDSRQSRAGGGRECVGWFGFLQFGILFGDELGVLAGGCRLYEDVGRVVAGPHGWATRLSPDLGFFAELDGLGYFVWHFDLLFLVVCSAAC